MPRPPFALFLSCAAAAQAAPAPLDALRYALVLDVDVEAQHLRGSVDYDFAALQDIDHVRLDALRGPDWRVEFEGTDGAPLATRWDDTGVEVALPAPVPKGGHARFRARLDGTPADGFYFARNRYGERLAFTDHYAVRAHAWLPCIDDPGDRAQFALELRYAKDLHAVASGAPLPATEPAPGHDVLKSTTLTAIAPYMFAVVVGPFAEVAEAGDPRLRPHLVYRADVDKAVAMLTHEAVWIAAMERAFGPYPFAKYQIVQCPTRWGGFEAPGNVQVSEALFDHPQGSGTLAHELVHMWFGDGVGYAPWREVWLSEGFASYFGPWLEAGSGGTPLRDAMAAMRAQWLRAPEGRRYSVRWDGFTDPVQALNANTYPKGAWVLHMLRGELGEALFWQAIRNAYRSGVGRAVTTADFVATVERVAGRDLHWFFDQWLDHPGCPELRVTAARDRIEVEQVQRAAPFRCRLRLKWRDAAGLHDQVLQLQRANTAVPVEGDVAELEVDPDIELLFRAVGRG